MKRGERPPRPEPSPRRQSPLATSEAQVPSHAALLHRLREIRMVVEGWQATSVARTTTPAPTTDGAQSGARPAAPKDAAEGGRLAQEFQLRLLKTWRTLEDASHQLQGILAPPAHAGTPPSPVHAPAPLPKASASQSTPLAVLPIKAPKESLIPVCHASTQSERSPPSAPAPAPSKPPPLVSTATQSSPKPQIWESRSPCSLASQASPAPAGWAIPAASVRGTPFTAATALPRDSPAPFSSFYGDFGESVSCKAHLVRPDDLTCGCCEWCGQRVDTAETATAAEAAEDDICLRNEHNSAESIDGSISSLWAASRRSLSTEASSAAVPAAQTTNYDSSTASRPAIRSAALAALKLRRLSQLSA